MIDIHSIILGVVQGLTEFIPVSSTGHLILVRQILGLPIQGSLSFDAILQLATGFAVLIYFWRDIWNIIKNRDFKLISILIIGSIPAVILGWTISDYMDTLFRGTKVVAITLILGALLFYVAEKLAKQNRELNFKNGLVIGVFQCLALVPGMSRSGSTISGGLISGLNREIAAKFSFLLSLPIIFGSGLYKVYDLVNHGELASLESSLIVASVSAFLSGLLAIHFLIKFLRNHSLNWFGLYRVILAFVVLLFL